MVFHLGIFTLAPDCDAWCCPNLGSACYPRLWEESPQRCIFQAKGWVSKSCSFLMSHLFFKYLHQPLWQKMAIRDQPATVELLQISCLMAYLWPKMEAHLGKCQALDDLQRMWQMGCLGWKVFFKFCKKHKKPCILGASQFIGKHAVEFEFRCTNLMGMPKWKFWQVISFLAKIITSPPSQEFVQWNLNSAARIGKHS